MAPRVFRISAGDGHGRRLQRLLEQVYHRGGSDRARGSVHWEQFRAIVHFDVQDDIDDGLLRRRMKSETKTGDGFVIRTPTLLYGVSFRPFGAIFASKTTLMSVSSDTTTTE